MFIKSEDQKLFKLTEKWSFVSSTITLFATAVTILPAQKNTSLTHNLWYVFPTSTIIYQNHKSL